MKAVGNVKSMELKREAEQSLPGGIGVFSAGHTPADIEQTLNRLDGAAAELQGGRA